MVNVYLPNATDNTVSVVDAGTNSATATISVGTSPRAVAVTPDGTKAYVANANPTGSGTISVIDASTNTVSATIQVGSQPLGVAITPDGTKAYVTNFTGVSVSVIDVATNAVLTTITVATDPVGVAITPDGRKAYVASLVGTVSVIDTSTNAVTATVTVGSSPHGVAITPNGKYAYVTNYLSNTVSVIDTSTHSLSATIPVGTSPYGIAITLDGGKALVGNNGAGTVSVIATGTNTVSATISVGMQPNGIAITPDNKKAYVPNFGSNSTSVIDISTNTVSATLTAGNGPAAFGQFIQPPSIPMTSTYTAPQGRLTLTSNTPVMTADAINQTSVYYNPYQGNIVPIYDGANMQSYTFGQLTMALNTSNQLSGKIYDLFAFLNSGVVTIGAGPAWSSTTARGTGAGTTQLQQTDGLWTNANSMTLTNGSTSYSGIPAGEATYLGSVYMTANGQTGMQFNPTPVSGGAAPILGVYNAYNRVAMNSINSDAATSWTYTGGTWRNANNNANNKVSFIDGLAQSYIDASYNIMASSSTTTTGTAVGIGITGGSPNRAAIITSTTDTWLAIREGFSPLLGLNYIQAMEIISLSGGTGTYTPAGGSCMLLSLFIEI